MSRKHDQFVETSPIANGFFSKLSVSFLLRQGLHIGRDFARYVQESSGRVIAGGKAIAAKAGRPFLPAPTFTGYMLLMPRRTTKTIRLDREDAQALKRAQADGLSPSDLVRRGLRIVAGRYYSWRRRPPKITLFVSTDPHLGEESQLYKDFRE